ncbi:rhomboid family intramembrane serine protease [Paenibacillus apiarius]|uniref:Rhomboid family intramembrane serine protease n=1 Tax=Paenibacillus apiarius TaxID=46240 RepID=A0ABT4E379_9BACL|nr:rhomboid family intramembrane serine protease [Paenibacillus apiarius]MCY9517844.1 rhomboid family intramembrane serine protease [Paenibacillus apiarius]MCY9522691.1 rhomboid family intramembrane serine protease [Paenibacillus apiarius]MCY9555376.1 rhomboid family intramembrane serine protease [Paenibacillus apiarius]MCY9561256.1 rhomboid family intramembrane serine protease [Paenibacillus apiarius]MCY9686551.1 rhomboid family intramembrane serine protease [Paenibacillus apiarius]
MEVNYGKSLKEYTSNYPVTFYLIAINTCVLVISILLDFIYESRVLKSLLGINTNEFEPWRFVLYAFVHNGLQHYLSNHFFFLIMGPPLEIALGKIRYVLFIITSILSTSVIVYIFDSAEGVVGASGIGFGMMAIFIYLFVFVKHVMSKRLKIVVLAWTIIAWITTFTIAGTSISGHVGGFVGGALFSLIALNKEKIEGNWNRKR